MRQFETIFLRRISSLEYDARIFTVDEELDFAGHPILGATGVVHAEGNFKDEVSVLFHLNNKDDFCNFEFSRVAF